MQERLMQLAITSAGFREVPFVWFWPDQHLSCATVTHDVETATGRDFCVQLMEMNDAHGIKGAFQVIPEQRYEVPQSFLDSIRCRGHEVNVHDLNHDGRLFNTREKFRARVKDINRYGREFEAKGFRSGALYRHPDWIKELEFDYDMSVPNVAHLDPQRGGCCTVMPYFIGDVLEIPVTTIQDYPLFHILRDYSLDIWKTQVREITRAHGMASFIIHPDYVIEQKARSTYEQLLSYLADIRESQNVWIAQPHEINDWWRARAQMSLVQNAGGWQIEGEGSEHAQIAYARVDGDRVVYRF
jgi:hypothetical protein